VTAAAAGGQRPDGQEPAARQAARVRRLLLWYPRAWRDRYGEEFAELLAAELAEPGPSRRWTANIAVTGLRSRLAGAGLAGHPLDPAAAASASLATAATCVAVSVLAGATMWAQLAVGLQWTVPRDHGITLAMGLMSGALLLLALLTVLAAVPAAWAALAAAARGHGRPFLWPGAMIVCGVAVLVTGGHHVENGWPGTGGHLLAHQGVVPGGVAAFGWAATMWITTYWAHPAALAAFPVTQIGWMLLSPAAIGCVVTGTVRLMRRVRLSARAFRYETWLATVAWVALAAFLAGALSWLVSAGGGQEAGSLFRVGSIDRAGFAVLAGAMLCCAAAVRQARAAAAAVGPARPAAPPR